MNILCKCLDFTLGVEEIKGKEGKRRWRERRDEWGVYERGGGEGDKSKKKKDIKERKEGKDMSG